MISEYSTTVDHFKKHGQLGVPRWHYELHFDNEDQEQLFRLAEETSRQVLDQLPEGKHFYPEIPMNKELNRAHETVYEAVRQDGEPGQYSEGEMREYDEKLREQVLKDRGPLKLEIGAQLMLGEDALLFSVAPHDELVTFRNQVRAVFGHPSDSTHTPHVSRAYSRECADTSEIYRVLEATQIQPAVVSVSGLTRVLQWSNGEYYEWDDDARLLLPFGGVN